MSTNPDELPQPRIVPRPEHTVSRSLLSVGARKVLYRLHRSGQLAYLVGGAVRDILLDKQPKDFDIATDARPRDVRRLFRNSRVIGRRFRLVHVLFGDEIVEVSTFRASPEPEPHPDEVVDGENAAADEAGHLNDGPVFGTPAEDAWRRDFTVNALFYNVADFTVIDYVGGLQDLRDGVVRTIGEPGRRFTEDPVRMMRAVEYSTRLGFSLAPDTARAIKAQHGLILDASPARLAYELLETLRSRRASEILRGLHRYGLLEDLHPVAANHLENVVPMLSVLDGWLEEGLAVDDAVLLAVLAAPPVMQRLRCHVGQQVKIDNVQLLDEVDRLLVSAAQNVPCSNHVNHLMRHGLFLLSKLVRPPGRNRQVLKVARSEAFPVAWSLLRVWVDGADGPSEMLDAWSKAIARARQGGADAGRQRRRPRRRSGARRQRT